MISILSFPERTGASYALFTGIRISFLISLICLISLSDVSAQCVNQEDIHFRFGQGSGSSVSVGPNPAITFVDILAGSEESFVSFAIVDAQGNEVFSSSVQGFPQITVGLVPGTYTLYIETNQQTVVKQQQILCQE